MLAALVSGYHLGGKVEVCMAVAFTACVRLEKLHQSTGVEVAGCHLEAPVLEVNHLKQSEPVQSKLPVQPFEIGFE